MCYRGQRRYVPDYPPAPAPEVVGESGYAAGTYLITGGLGDVGLTVAEHLAGQGAAGVILTSRDGLPHDPEDRRNTTVQRIRALGVEVRVAEVDVTDLDAMRRLFDGPRIDGVIHAAAESRPETFHPLSDLDVSAVSRHFAAKVGGARVLGAALAELPPEQAPDWCVLFSSTAALLGGIAFGSYAAANAALTACSRQLSGQLANTRVTSASWDTWASTLERIEGEFGTSMAAHSMTAEESLDAFDRIVRAGAPAVVVVAGGLTGRLPETATATEPEPGAATRYPRPDLVQPYQKPLTATERALAQLWSDVLGVEPVGTGDNFFDLGGSSLLALQMLSLLRKRIGVAVPTVTLFEAPTVRALAAVVDAQGGTATTEIGRAHV